MTRGRPSTALSWKMFQPRIFLSVMTPLSTLPSHRRQPVWDIVRLTLHLCLTIILLSIPAFVKPSLHRANIQVIGDAFEGNHTDQCVSVYFRFAYAVLDSPSGDHHELKLKIEQI